MFSMGPFHWPENKIKEKIERNPIWSKLERNDFGGIRNILSKLQNHSQIRELTYLASEPAYLAIESPSEMAMLFVLPNAFLVE